MLGTQGIGYSGGFSSSALHGHNVVGGSHSHNHTKQEPGGSLLTAKPHNGLARRQVRAKAEWARAALPIGRVGEDSQAGCRARRECSADSMGIDCTSSIRST